MAWMDDDEPVFCMTCLQTTRIRCPHVRHRGEDGPKRRSAPGGGRIPAGTREYRSWTAPAEPAWQAQPDLDLKRRQRRLDELTR